MFRKYVAGNLLSYNDEVYVVVRATLKMLNLRSFFDDNRTITLISAENPSHRGCILSNYKNKVASIY